MLLIFTTVIATDGDGVLTGSFAVKNANGAGSQLSLRL